MMRQHPGKVDPGEFETGVRHKQQTATFGKPDGTVADTPDQFLQSRTVPFHQTMRGTPLKHSPAQLDTPAWLHLRGLKVDNRESQPAVLDTTARAGTQQRSPKQKLKAELPDRTQEPEHGKWSGQDFTKTNALSIINASPPRREEPLLWTQKPDFGKVPDYLVQAQRQQSREHAEREAAEALRLQQVCSLGSVCSARRLCRC